MNRSDAPQTQTFHLLDYVAVLRPTLLFPAWTLVLLGYHHGRAAETIEATQPLHLAGTLCLYTLLMGAVYIVNQIADKETDAADDKLYLVAQGYVKLQILKWQVGILITLSMLLNLLVFWKNPAYLILILLSIILGFTYVNFRLKENVIIWGTRLGILVLSLCAGILFPLYLLWFGIVLLGTRWYYTTRFGIRYP